MEHDIRDLFSKEDFVEKEIPKNHRENFIEKLGKHQPKKDRKRNYKALKIVASFLLMITCAYFYKNTIPSPEKSSVEIKMESIEKDYLISIEKEWNSFMEVTKDSILIKKYEVKLKESNIDYQKITKQLTAFPNNINVLQSLIDNLQRRLQLIKDIKEHINELNQKNTSNETIYL
ncbi:MAG: peptidoglycan hydrolase CwlO-like protein [Polaribacter sp.]|jgi:peptidoglycan hydrolase CwlO-like protein